MILLNACCPVRLFACFEELLCSNFKHIIGVSYEHVNRIFKVKLPKALMGKRKGVSFLAVNVMFERALFLTLLCIFDVNFSIRLESSGS